RALLPGGRRLPAGKDEIRAALRAAVAAGGVNGGRARCALLPVLVQQLAQVDAERLAGFGVLETVRHGRLQIAELVPAVVAAAGERVRVHRLVVQQVGNGVGQLDLAAGPALRRLQLVEDLRREQVTTHDREVRGRVRRRRLLDDLRDAR